MKTCVVTWLVYILSEPFFNLCCLDPHCCVSPSSMFPWRFLVFGFLAPSHLIFGGFLYFLFFFLREREKENRGGRQWCDVSHDPPMLILTDTLADIQGGSLFPSHITAANKGTTNKRSLHVTKRVTPRWPPSVLQRRHRRALANLHTYSSFTGISLHYY